MNIGELKEKIKDLSDDTEIRIWLDDEVYSDFEYESEFSNCILYTDFYTTKRDNCFYLTVGGEIPAAYYNYDI